jgi:hypothetical protein
MAKENADEKQGQVLTFPPCTVDVWLTEDVLAELTRDAAREGVTLSTFVRRVVSEEMERLKAARRRKRIKVSPTSGLRVRFLALLARLGWLVTIGFHGLVA